MANGRKPTHILKHDIRGEDGKTTRSVRIGAFWSSPDGVKPGRIKLEYVPTTWDGSITVWENTERPE